MYSLTRFTLRDMTECGAALRRLGVGARGMEDAANRVVRYLYDCLGDEDGRDCVLVRFFVTTPFIDLEPELQEFARGLLGGEEPRPEMKCLTLLASVGDEPAWNSRSSSASHKALPLASEPSIARSPMIARLITQFGIEVASILAPDRDFVVDAEQHNFNVFHVPEALGSPYIPAQRDFVVPYGVQSVLGFGGVLPTGDLFVTILFSRRHIPRQTADMFKTLALNVKLAILPFAGARVFT